MSAAQDVPARASAVVVGGGIIGLAIAEELGERGLDVVVLDDGGKPGNATHASAGMIAPAAESDVELPGLCEFRQWSHGLYPKFVERVERLSGIQCGFRTDGTLLVALDRDQREEVERLRNIMEDQGFSPQALGPDQVLQMEPNLSRRVVGGLLLEHDYNIDQRRLVEALRVAIDRHGGRVLSGALVERVRPAGVVEGRFHAGRGGGRFRVEGENVVVAAGSWSNVDLDSPCAPLPLRPVKGQVLRLRAPELLRRVVRTPDIYMVPHAGGDLVLGATVEEQGFDAQPTAGATFDMLRHAWRALPGIYDLPIAELSVGFRPVARDHLPVLGRITPGVCVATAHYRNGILLAPGTARILGRLICDGAEHALLEHFDPARFGTLSGRSLQAARPRRS